jgi:ABC-type multidrug transport system, ATPase component
MQVVSVKGLSKSFSGHKVLEDVSFQIAKGDIIGYLGKNGAGKTTTINSILGLLRFNAGKIEVFGKDIADYETNLGEIGVLLEFNGFYERLTAKQNVEFYLTALSKEINQYEFQKLLSIMELDGKQYDKVRTYSKGMKRKLALIRILLQKPKLIILDEPFDGIDLEARSIIIKQIKTFRENTDASIIMTSHVMADIEELASRIIVLNKGGIIADETIQEFHLHEGATMTDKYLRMVEI